MLTSRLPARAALRAAALLGVLVLLVLGGAVAPAPASAAVREVRLTMDGPDPASLRVAPGDTLRFVNVDAFPHRAVSSTSNWRFDTGPLLPGQAHDVETPLTAPGTYGYQGAGLDDFTGVVVVPAPIAAAPPATRPAPAPAAPRPAPAASSAPPAAPAAPAPAASSPAAAAPQPTRTGGSGSVQGPPPLAGGVLPPPGAPFPDGPLPQVAPFPADGPVLPGTDVSGDGAVRDLGGSAPVAIGELPLGTPVDARRVGLPVALAVLVAGGVASLIVRLLLAEAPRPAAG